MSNLRLTVFDIFSYTVPGLCYILLFAYGIEKINLEGFLLFASKLSALSGFVFLCVSYLIGFVFDTLAGKFITKLTDYFRGDLEDRVLKKFNKRNPKTTIEEYHFSKIYSFADINAAQSREKADQYSAMSGLAKNLSLAFFIFPSITFIYSIMLPDKLVWTPVIVKSTISILVSIILMIKADTFRCWSHTHLLYITHLLSQEKEPVSTSE